jgi:hypothetical protein
LNNRLIELIPDYFESRPTLSKEELADAIREDFPNWSDATINVRISELKKKDIVQNPSRGLYTIRQKASYVPEISSKLKRLYNSLNKDLPYATFCVWDSKWLNEFMRHQPFHYYTVTEVEKEVMESAFHALSGSYTGVFLDPDKEVFERYISKTENPVIIKQMVSESPTCTIKLVEVPKIEKLLVDMLIDTDLYGAQQNEIDFIYKSVLDKYCVNQVMMKRYAHRRNRENELTEILGKTLANNE